MSLRLTAEVVCDARRPPGCHGASAAPPGEALPTVVFEGMTEAERAGWGKAGRGHRIRDDGCPACRAARPASGPQTTRRRAFRPRRGASSRQEADRP